jgi:DNA 3'-phosphatase
MSTPQTVFEKKDYFIYIPTTIKKDAKKIWMFDVDGTILTSMKGSKIADEDFILLGPIEEIFSSLESDGAVVALVSNQQMWNEAQAKFERLRILFPTVIQAIATGKGSPFRKPGTGLYDLILQLGDLKQIKERHYVGDAIGPSASYPPYRWASSDAEFAAAVDAEFHEPLELFPHSPEPKTSVKKELILFVGNPGAGKSTLAAKFGAHGYAVVNQDTIGTRAKVLKAAKEAWAFGSSVIIDATNPSREKRQEIIDAVGATKDQVRIFWFIRDGRPFNALRPEPVPEIAYRMYTKYFETPTEDEGSVEIIY